MKRGTKECFMNHRIGPKNLDSFTGNLLNMFIFAGLPWNKYPGVAGWINKILPSFDEKKNLQVRHGSLQPLRHRYSAIDMSQPYMIDGVKKDALGSRTIESLWKNPYCIVHDLLYFPLLLFIAFLIIER